MRTQSTIRKGYERIIKEIQQHRPHLNSRATVIERALDFYIQSIKEGDQRDNKRT